MTTVGAQPPHSAFPLALLVMSNPIWLQTMTKMQWTRASAALSVVSGSVGLVLRYADVNNFIYVAFNATALAVQFGCYYLGSEYR